MQTVTMSYLEDPKRALEDEDTRRKFLFAPG